MHRAALLAALFVTALMTSGRVGAQTSASDRAYVRQSNNEWILGNDRIELNLVFSQRQLRLRSMRLKSSGYEVAPVANSRPSIPLQLIGSRTVEGPDGRLLLAIRLNQGHVVITRNLEIYPHQTIVREWRTFKNEGARPVELGNPDIMDDAFNFRASGSTSLYWMTGGYNRRGSWRLQKESLGAGATRKFDSDEPFPLNEDTPVYLNFGRYFKQGSGSYAPWIAVQGADGKAGIFVGWDYFGHWQSKIAKDARDDIRIGLNVEGYRARIAPGAMIESPKGYIGLFDGDLDNAGNELLDWQYRYFWDFTREPWFTAVRLMGKFPADGTGYARVEPKTGHLSWTHGSFNNRAVIPEIFRQSDLLRYVGGEEFHRDWGWWDRAGDWSAPSFGEANDYLRKSEIGLLVYAPVYLVDRRSKLALSHPSWVAGYDRIGTKFPNGIVPADMGGTLDLSMPEVRQHVARQLDIFAQQWGPFEWRNDSIMLHQRGEDETPLLGQDQGVRELIAAFLTRHPTSAFQGVNMGGLYAGGPDYTRLSSTISFSDGAVGTLGNYWASLLMPPDKVSDIPKIDVDSFDPEKSAALMTFNFELVGDTVSTEKLEAVRKFIEQYKYLRKMGVVGRWVHVFRPKVNGDDATMYFERLSGDGNRGVVIIKRRPSGSAQIHLKGLHPNLQYQVELPCRSAPTTRIGQDLMDDGIRLDPQCRAGLIYLNLPLHPGSGLDTTAPAAPTALSVEPARNLGHDGVELRWRGGQDDNWISYFAIYRDGELIDKVANGSFYFDHSAGADPGADYEVQTVDGDGNGSPRMGARHGRPTISVIDDGSNNVQFTGPWSHEKLDPSAANKGTISAASAANAGALFRFTGTSMDLFVKRGPDCGLAEISVDGAPGQIIDTYSAVNIWGTSAFHWKSTRPGSHTVRVTVLGRRKAHVGEDSATVGTKIYLDAIRVAGNAGVQ